MVLPEASVEKLAPDVRRDAQTIVLANDGVRSTEPLHGEAYGRGLPTVTDGIIDEIVEDLLYEGVGEDLYPRWDIIDDS